MRRLYGRSLGLLFAFISVFAFQNIRLLLRMDKTAQDGQRESSSSALFIDKGNFWSVDANRTWTWHNQGSEVVISTRHKANISLQRSFANVSLLLYGSSHVRALYFHILRLHRGWMPQQKLESYIMDVPSGYPNGDCDPGHTGFRDGLYGVDLEQCGEPGKRVVTEVSSTFIYAFKTFLHTPQADDRLLDFLQENQLRHPRVVVVDVGVWGPRGNKQSKFNERELSYKQEVEYFVSFLENSFPKSSLVFIFDSVLPNLKESSYPSEQDQADIILQRISRVQSAVIWRKDWLLESRPDELPCRHGCEGPLLHLMALQLWAFLQQLS